MYIEIWIMWLQNPTTQEHLRWLCKQLWKCGGMCCRCNL